MLAVNRIYEMDSLEGMRQLPDECCDCCVTDPPYGIRFMGKRWDYEIPAVEVWKEVLRVLKPGAHLLCACGTRTQHRMAVNIEDAGFEIRDVICWHYGQGFPKSMNVALAIDKHGGAIGDRGKAFRTAGAGDRDDLQERNGSAGMAYESPITNEAKQWNGWGTALKPATEFWTLARKQLGEKTVAENIVRHGIGGLNIDASRISAPDAQGGSYMVKRLKPGATLNKTGGNWRPEEEDAELHQGEMKEGRFPANLILDEFMAREMDEQTGILSSGMPAGFRKATNNIYGKYAPGQDVTGYGDSGGASRFFYVAKADATERGIGNNHPTVKPLALMHYLIKLICPLEPERIVLEPFAGSGSTCIAARQLDLKYIAFELDAAHIRIAQNRLRSELGLFYDGQGGLGMSPVVD
jgi:hypothetical protein